MSANSVSVIIPCHNAAEHIAACLNSVQKQSLHDVEVICVDDGSDDSTVEIIGGMATTSVKEIRLLRHECVKGVSAARNTGLRAAGGKYVFFLDADDTIYDEFSLQALYEAAEVAGNDVAIGRLLRWFPDTDERLPVAAFQADDVEFQETTILRSPELVYNDRACGKLILKRLLTENSIYFDDNLLIYFEIPFSCRLYMAAASIRILGKTVYISRLHTSESCIAAREEGPDAGEALLRVVADLYAMTRDAAGHAAVFGQYLKQYTLKSLSLFMHVERIDAEILTYVTVLRDLLNRVPSAFFLEDLKNIKDKIQYCDYRYAYTRIHNYIYRYKIYGYRKKLKIKIQKNTIEKLLNKISKKKYKIKKQIKRIEKYKQLDKEHKVTIV